MAKRRDICRETEEGKEGGREKGVKREWETKRKMEGESRKRKEKKRRGGCGREGEKEGKD